MKGRERERMEKRGIRSYTCEEIYKFRCKHGTIRRSVTKIASRSSASRSLKLGAHTHTHTHTHTRNRVHWLEKKISNQLHIRSTDQIQVTEKQAETAP